jgi:CBS domain-containing protein
MDGGRRIEVAQVMTSSVVTVTPGTGVQVLVGKLAEHPVSGVPVVDEDGRHAGVVTEADLLREGSHDLRRTRTLSVVGEDGRLGGIVSRVDLLSAQSTSRSLHSPPGTRRNSAADCPRRSGGGVRDLAGGRPVNRRPLHGAC